jgi:hypothetical protein
MRTRTWMVALAVVTFGFLPELARAQPAAHYLDETTLHVRLWNADPEGGYQVMVDAVVYGVGSSQDAVRVDVKQGSSTLVSTRCGFDARDGDAGQLSCRTDGSRRLRQTGNVTIELAYVDDVAETTTVMRTLRVNVRAYPYWVRNDDRNRPIMGAMHQIDGSDLLGTAFAYMVSPNLRQTQADESQRMQLFTAFSGTYSGYSAVLRCRVGEERIPDREISVYNYNDFGVDERLSPTSDTRRVGWYRTRYEMQDLWWGTRINIPPSGTGYDTTNVVFLGEHPGLWSCDVRSEGNVLRTFRFDVDAQGRVMPHALEAAPATPRMLNGLHIVDVRIPSPSPRDAAFDPAPIRAGWQFGTPWAVPAAVAEMLRALPAASGSSAPSAARGGRRR